MRTNPIPAVVLCLLTPLLALAQGVGVEPTQTEVVTHSSAFWFWIIAFAVAAVAFVLSNVVFDRRLNSPFRRRTV